MDIRTGKISKLGLLADLGSTEMPDEFFHIKGNWFVVNVLLSYGRPQAWLVNGMRATQISKVRNNELWYVTDIAVCGTSVHMIVNNEQWTQYYGLWENGRA